jgi:hypothetical protein
MAPTTSSPSRLKLINFILHTAPPEEVVEVDEIEVDVMERVRYVVEDVNIILSNAGQTTN